MKDALLVLITNKQFVLYVTAAFIFGLTQLLKMPIKHFTGKIKDELTRKRVNAVILLLPFILGFAFELVYSVCSKTPFDLSAGAAFGTVSIAYYGFVERFFGIKKVNPYTATEIGKQTADLVQDIVKDGKVTDEEVDAVKAFYKKIGKTK